MKNILLIIFNLAIFGIPALAQYHNSSGPGQKKGQVATNVVYSCPMHPEVRSSTPGKCPKCGMELVKKINKPRPKNIVLKNSTDSDSSQIVELNTQESNNTTTKDNVNASLPDITLNKVDMSPGKTVRYDLYITDTMVNYAGKMKHAYAVNGHIPGPDLVFTEGDTAAIYVHNNLKKDETSIHWHGVILPNQFDGVPYLTTQPVHPGEVHLYKFAVVQNGTYWYHSHSGLQEQIGIYGAIIFKKRKGQSEIVMPIATETGNLKMPERDMKSIDMPGMSHKNEDMHQISTINEHYNTEQTVVLSEWTDEKPQQVQRRLTTGNDWYAIKKGSVQSYYEAIKAGHFKTKVINEWKRMKAMDVSDVYYNRFLINGQPVTLAPEFKAGDRVRLRIVNAGGSSYFWLQYSGGKMTVIANDGNDVVPVDVDRLIVGVSETYDVVVSIPDNKSYEFRATPEDRTQAASLWLGKGPKVPAPVLPRLKYFEGMQMMNSMMKMNGDMKMMDMDMSLQQMDMNTPMYAEMGKGDDPVTLNYAMLRSPVKTMLPDAPYKELHFTLTGNMNRYVWSMNNKVIGEWDKILIKKGENVRVVLFNNSMMRHPMHLHGHDFRVLNGQGEYAPLKNVLDIMPMERDTFEFAGSQSGDWFFHCHILYHMMAGMGTVFSYKNSPANPEFPNPDAAYNKFLRGERMLHAMANIGLQSNGSDGMLMLSSTRYALRSEWHIGHDSRHGQESETYLGRYLGKMQWLFPFVGFDYHHNSRINERRENAFGQISNQSNRRAFITGLEYTLPMLIVAQARVDSKGKFRFQLERDDIPLASRLRLHFMVNTDKEYTVGLNYIVRKWLDLSTHYDSDMGLGAGVTIVY